MDHLTRLVTSSLLRAYEQKATNIDASHADGSSRLYGAHLLVRGLFVYLNAETSMLLDIFLNLPSGGLRSHGFSS